MCITIYDLFRHLLSDMPTVYQRIPGIAISVACFFYKEVIPGQYV